MNQIDMKGLAELRKKLPGARRTVEIMRLSLGVSDANIGDVRNAVLHWAREKSFGDFEAAAWRHEGFDHDVGGRTVQAVRIEMSGNDIWALRAEDPDSAVPGRNWSTEIVLGRQGDGAGHFSLRLLVTSDEPDIDIEPSVPKFVADLCRRGWLSMDGRDVDARVIRVETPDDVEDLCDHIMDPRRRAPAFAVSLPEGDGRAALNVEALAKAVAGLAHVYVIGESASYAISDTIGKKLSVYAGAVRAYMPGFDETSDPYEHRLFLAPHLNSGHARAGARKWLRWTAAETSLRMRRLERDVLGFPAVREASKRIQADALRDQAVPDNGRIEALEELVATLESQIEEKNRDAAASMAMASGAEKRALESERNYRALLHHIRQTSGSTTHAVEEKAETYPQTWAAFTEWAQDRYADRISFTSTALRRIRNAAFEDVSRAARAVEWLATTGREARIHGGSGNFNGLVVEPGVINAACGGDAYTVSWQGRKHEVNWHIKGGGNTRDPKRCLRIYYFFEPETEQIVIDHMPAHRTTSMS